MYQAHFSKFLQANAQRLHFAAHSHHYWPDVTQQAVLQCWHDAMAHVDDKWNHIFSEVVPTAQNHIARILDVDAPQNIAFAPNTHEFVARLLSTFAPDRPLRILTTDSEFHSFTRQVNRLAELATVSVTRIPTEPFGTFGARFREAARAPYDLIFLSHVFYNSGFVVDNLAEIVAAVPSPDTIIVVDGYHAFCALPVSLRAMQERIFYTAGGYKYAMSGEGVCFLYVPPGCHLRPLNTGWFATFGDLTETADDVRYSNDAFRFWGATFDPTGLYRFNAVMAWMVENVLSIETIHAYIHDLQHDFLRQMVAVKSPIFNSDSLLISNSFADRGHFLTYRLPQASEICAHLKTKGVVTDFRHDRLRFGFGLYHTKQDVARLVDVLAGISLA